MPRFSFRRLLGKPLPSPLEQAITQTAALEDTYAAMDAHTLAQTTPRLRARLAAKDSLDSLLPEAFAAVREAARRCLGLRAYDVQIRAGFHLHHGRVAEMKTGEGKTLMAAFPAYLNALSGKGVHVITVNTYLAQRDCDTMRPVFAALGASTGLVHAQQNEAEKKAAYGCDITYSTNHELGFDFLRDGLKTHEHAMLQRGHAFAIIDEIDSILIDEARTPLIISGPGTVPGQLCATMATIVAQAEPHHWKLDEKNRQAIWTEAGDTFLEEQAHAHGLLPPGIALYDPESGPLLHRAAQALKARLLYQRDHHYVVANGAIGLVDESTGRIMTGRRLSEGLHQAIEAKEGVEVAAETVTLASVSLQNFFRGYTKIAGMTGTARTEAQEFQDIYGLDVVAIPTHRPIARVDEPDRIFARASAKWDAIVACIVEAHRRGQPVLAGTGSVERSETLARLLAAHHIPHRVLNARHHGQEAAIIAQAGRWGAVTIATNMAGRGTDIQLGGSVDARVHDAREAIFARFQSGQDTTLAIDEMALRQEAEASLADERQRVLDVGGLLVIGTERHESRRVDNQLRGRAGRQGDPGRSIFFVSLEDDLMRVFGGEKIAQTFQKMGLAADEAIVHPWVSRSIETAQRRVEERHFDARKNILKYDDIINEQRKIAHKRRLHMMRAAQVRPILDGLQETTILEATERHAPPRTYAEAWDLDGLARELAAIGIPAPVHQWAQEDGVDGAEIAQRAYDMARQQWDTLEASVGPQAVDAVARHALLESFDTNWRDHVMQMDFLKTTVGFQSYAQRDPIHEYRTQAYTLFEEAIANARRDAVRLMGSVRFEPVAPNPHIFGPTPSVAHA